MASSFLLLLAPLLHPHDKHTRRSCVCPITQLLLLLLVDDGDASSSAPVVDCGVGGSGDESGEKHRRWENLISLRVSFCGN